MQPESRRDLRVGAFLGAEAVSAIGSWATMVAIWGYAAFKFDATSTDVAVFGLAFSVPPILVGPFTGHLVDRFGPKATLAAAKVLGVVASLALLTADTFRALAVLSALHGVSSALSHPAIQSMPPRLVDDRHLARTNALVSLTDELAIILGPVAAGVAIQLFGFRGAFVFDAATYGLGLLALPAVHLRPASAVAADAAADASGGPSEGHGLVHEALAGWRYIVRSDRLRRIVACTFAVNLLYGCSLLAEPLYVRDVLERSPSTFAALQTVFGCFLVAAGLLAARLGERLAGFGFVAFGVGASGVTAIIYLGTDSVVIAFGGVALWGVVTAFISGPSRTLLQRGSPETTHGRVLSADMVTGSLAQMCGIAVGGLAIDRAGVPTTLAVLGTAVAGSAALLAAADRRAEHRRPVVPAATDAEAWPRPEPLATEPVAP